MYANDARKWFDLARKVSTAKGERFDELNDWLGLVRLYSSFPCILVAFSTDFPFALWIPQINGISIEESRAQRKAEAIKSMHDPPSSTPSQDRHHDVPPFSAPSSPSAVLLPAKSPRSILKARSRQQRSSSQSHGSHGSQSQDEQDGDVTITNLRPALPSSKLGRHADTNDPQRHDDSDDDDDPFGRSRNEKKKRKREDRIVTFASVDAGFDLDMSD
jgi:hypothetical protein